MGETLICKKCGKELKQGWQICPFCKTPIATIRLCRNCATEWKPGWQACPVCGCEEMEEAAQPASAEPSPRLSSAPGPMPDGFVYVEGGTFMMGSPETEEGHKGNELQHQVTVSGFYIGKYVVTQKEWQEIMGTTIRRQRTLVSNRERTVGEGDNYPMYYINCYEAVEYCNRRSLKEKLTPSYCVSEDSITCDWNANGYRLPTEAEWEYAARGGNDSPGNYIYAGSDNADSVAWYEKNSGKTTHPVGTKDPNDLGLYDMSGNVWEWCWDWYGSYNIGSETNPHGSSRPGSLVSLVSSRVCRGGSWYHQAFDVRSAKRSSEVASTRYNYLGFRLVRSR